MKYKESDAKNRAVELLKAVRTPDGIGGLQQSYTKMVEVMANVKTSTRRIDIAKQQYLNRIIIEVMIYYYKSYNEVDAVRYSGKLYRVLDKENIGGQDKEIRFMLMQEAD